jgi:hypothetical protein
VFSVGEKKKGGLGERKERIITVREAKQQNTDRVVHKIQSNSKKKKEEEEEEEEEEERG